MTEIARAAEAALRRHPHPALRLRELLELVSSTDRTLTPGRLRAILEGYPDRFRIIEAWAGGRALSHPPRDDHRASASPTRREPRRAGDTGPDTVDQAWVVATDQPEPPPEGPYSATTLRESVRWLGRCVDARSRMELIRWYAIVMEERAARRALLERAG